MQRGWFRLGAVMLTLAGGLVHCVGEEPRVTTVDDRPDSATPPSDPPVVPTGDTGTTTPPIAEAGPDAADAGFDAGPPRCDRNKPFDAPALLPAVPGVVPKDKTIRVSQDELTAYYDCLPTGGGTTIEVCTASRGSLSDPFTSRTMFTLNPPGNAHRFPTVSGDQKVLIYTSTVGGVSKLFQARRTETGTPFAGGDELLGLNASEDATFTAHLLPSGNIVYFTSHVSDVGGYFIHRSQRNGVTAPFSTGVHTGIATSYAAVTEDETLMYFTHASNPTVMEVGRKPDAGWGTPSGPGYLQREVTELVGDGGASQDFPTWLSADGCVIYFASTRALPDAGPDAGSSNIWRAQRPL